MASEPRSKLNRLLRAWPQGTVAVSRWLEAQGAYQQLVHEYEKSGWIRRIGHGAYVRAGDTVEWSGGLHALQEQMKLPVHAGAKTALQMQGYANFLPMGRNRPTPAPADYSLESGGLSPSSGSSGHLLDSGSELRSRLLLPAQLYLPLPCGRTSSVPGVVPEGEGEFGPLSASGSWVGGSVSLFGASGIRLPAWFRQYDWGVELRYTATKLFADDPDAGLTKKELATYAVTVSAPERAIMEVLYLVSEEETFEEATLLMEGLTTLRPRLVQSLLEQCRSVKVKRLFMFLAEACSHVWVKKLDLSKVNFGKGKRMLVRGGQFDPKYNVYVPKRDEQRQKEVPKVKPGVVEINKPDSLRKVVGEDKGDSAMTISKVVDEKRAMILELAAKHGARDVRVFGSVSRGEAGPRSDVDILVDLEPGRSLMDLGGLLMDLEDLLGRKVDVVTEKGLHWYIREKVLKEAVRL